MSDNKDSAYAKNVLVSSEKPVKSKQYLIDENQLPKIKITDSLKISSSRKKTNKNKYLNSINLYPNFEPFINDQIKPIKINFNIIQTEVYSYKDTSPRVGYYLPVIEKKKYQNRLFRRFNKYHHSNKIKISKLPKLNNFENHKSSPKNRKNSLITKNSSSMLRIFDDYNDTNLYNIVETRIKSSVHSKPYNNDYFRSKDIYQDEIDRKNKMNKEQFLLRGKYQYCKGHEKCKSNAISKERERELMYDDCKKQLENCLNVINLSNDFNKKKKLKLKIKNGCKIGDGQKSQKVYRLKQFDENEKCQNNNFVRPNIINKQRNNRYIFVDENEKTNNNLNPVNENEENKNVNNNLTSDVNAELHKILEEVNNNLLKEKKLRHRIQTYRRLVELISKGLKEISPLFNPGVIIEYRNPDSGLVESVSNKKLLNNDETEDLQLKDVNS